MGEGPRIGSLCSGYDGLALGLIQVIGGSLAWHSEVDPGANKILTHHWPDLPNHGDLTVIDWANVEPVDWLIGGYPCQPFSLAGKRKGSSDDRHLWPSIAYAVGRLRPPRLFFENVAGHVSLGLGTVLGDLASMGYDCRYGVVRASDAGAPHRRERLFIVAADTQSERSERGGGSWKWRSGSPDRHFTPPHTAGLRRGEGRAEPAGGCDLPAWGAYQPAITRWESVTGRSAPWPTEPGRHGQPRLSPRFVEWMMGLPYGWVTDVPDLTRNAQLKALGNGVVPQQAALALSLLLPLLDDR